MHLLAQLCDIIRQESRPTPQFLLHIIRKQPVVTGTAVCSGGCGTSATAADRMQLPRHKRCLSTIHGAHAHTTSVLNSFISLKYARLICILIRPTFAAHPATWRANECSASAEWTLGQHPPHQLIRHHVNRRCKRNRLESQFV